MYANATMGDCRQGQNICWHMLITWRVIVFALIQVVLCCYLIIPNLTSDKIVAAYYDGNRFITNLDGVWKVSC